MGSVGRWWQLSAVCLLALTGCQNNPFVTPQARSWQQQQQTPEYVSQLRDMQQKVEKLSSLNRDLTTQLAQSQQRTRLIRDETNLVKKQLSETAGELRRQTLAKDQSEQRLKAIQASNVRHGAATIRANNSVTRQLDVLNIPGYQVFTEGDVVRVEVPADQLFNGQSAQLRPAALAILDNIATALATKYQRQRIALEGHADPRSRGPYNSAHELTVAQATAVFQRLSQQSRLQARQLFIIGQGSNNPRYSNATADGQARNRRIELVVYPETID